MEIEDRLKHIKDTSGRSLHDHLLNVLGRLAEVRPIDPLRTFEEHSEFVASSGYNYTDVKNYAVSDCRRDTGPQFSDFLQKSAKYWVAWTSPGLLQRTCG